MIDPTVRISLAMYANKGAYAVLVGPGVSAAAGIPTAWQIDSDLIVRLARMDGADASDDPTAWYRRRSGENPTYLKLLNAVATSPAERAQLLQGYFEPTEEERRQGIKVPTAAHRTIAQLAASGHVRLFVTTNSDRLLERALDDVGIVPQVLSTPESISGAAPFSDTTCSILKLNGDYANTRISDGQESQAGYHPAVNAFLDRVIEEYGFIVAGWTAESDAGLAAAFERCRSYRYTMYWAGRNPPKGAAARLIELRRGEFVRTKDTDTFFSNISQSLSALDGVGAGPLNTGNTPAPTVTTEAEPDAADELADCPQCESPNLAHARFCSSCGTKLIAVCGECGTESAAEARFCLHCGARFGEARPARAQLERYIPKELLDKLDPPVHRAIWWANDVWSPCYFAT